MRLTFLAIGLVVSAACVMPPPGPAPVGVAPAAAGGGTVAATGGASCAETIVCYGACDPMTEDCMVRCEGGAAAGVPAQSRAVVACMATHGCDTLECLQASCPAEHDACFADLPAAPAAAAVPTVAAGPATPVNDGFEYETATFDDGWTATAQADWVLAEKQGVRVYLHHPIAHQASEFSGTGRTMRDHYWDTVVARDFATGQKVHRPDDIGMKAEYIEGWGTDRRTGEQRFLMMYVDFGPGFANVVVASARDEATLRSWFPNASNPFSSELPRLQRYNRFPVGARDLVGTWSDTDTSMMNWYNADTGAYAGATVAARSATFVFAGDGTYDSTHNGATGRIGAMNTFQQEYHGDYTISPWSLVATQRWEGATVTFSAHLRIVRGGRLLSLESQRGENYLLVRTAR